MGQHPDHIYRLNTPVAIFSLVFYLKTVRTQQQQHLPNPPPTLPPRQPTRPPPNVPHTHRLFQLPSMQRPTSPDEHQSRPRRASGADVVAATAASSSPGGTFLTASGGDMNEQRRNSILKMAGDIAALSQTDSSRKHPVSEDALARKLENNVHISQRKKQEQQRGRQSLSSSSSSSSSPSSRNSATGTQTATSGRKGRRRGSVNSGGGGRRRGSTGGAGRRMNLTKHHIEVWNHNFDRDEPPPMIMKAIMATGEVNLKELAQVGGDDLLGYPQGNDVGDTRSFMLLLS